MLLSPPISGPPSRPTRSTFGLSMTLDPDMPAGRAYRLHLEHDRYVVAINPSACCEHIEWEYERSLRGEPRELVHRAFGVPDPWIDLAGYRARAYWRTDDGATLGWFLRLERQGLLLPFAHAM